MKNIPHCYVFCLISCMKSACTSLFMKIQIPRAVKRNTFLTQLQFFFCLPYLECLCVYTRIHKKLHYDKMLFPFFAINTNCSCNFCTIISYFYQKHLGKQNDIFFLPFLIHRKPDLFSKSMLEYFSVQFNFEEQLSYWYRHQNLILI